MDAHETVLKQGSLSVRIERQADLTTIYACGELDLASLSILDQALREAEKTDVTRIILDLRELEFIDSTGLGILVAAARRSDADSDRLRVSHVSGAVARLMRLTGVDRVMNLVDDAG